MVLSILSYMTRFHLDFHLNHFHSMKSYLTLGHPMAPHVFQGFSVLLPENYLGLSGLWDGTQAVWFVVERAPSPCWTSGNMHISFIGLYTDSALYRICRWPVVPHPFHSCLTEHSSISGGLDLYFLAVMVLHDGILLMSHIRIVQPQAGLLSQLLSAPCCLALWQQPEFFS